MNTVTRKTSESEMIVTLDFSPVKSDYREKIETPLVFLNHMIEQIVWRGEFNIEVSTKLSNFYLEHVICEDLGICLGKAIKNHIVKNSSVGFGDSVAIIDEAYSRCAISFESRALLCFSEGLVSIPTHVEGMLSEDLVTFLDGFVQGAQCTLHIDIEKGKNAHHIWEAVFRSLGLCLKKACEVSETRKNMTSGVAGKVRFIEE